MSFPQEWEKARRTQEVDWISHVDWILRHAFKHATQFLFHALNKRPK